MGASRFTKPPVYSASLMYNYATGEHDGFPSSSENMREEKESTTIRLRNTRRGGEHERHLYTLVASFAVPFLFLFGCGTQGMQEQGVSDREVPQEPNSIKRAQHVERTPEQEGASAEPIERNQQEEANPGQEEDVLLPVSLEQMESEQASSLEDEALEQGVVDQGGTQELNDAESGHVEGGSGNASQQGVPAELPERSQQVVPEAGQTIVPPAPGMTEKGEADKKRALQGQAQPSGKERVKPQE
jgi:hypothetical protein